MKKIITTAITMATLGVAMAAPVTHEQAATVARTFWTKNLHGKVDARLVDRSADWSYDGIYLFSNPEGGFVMVAADDVACPILGYSTDNSVDPANLPVQLTEWLDKYQRQIDWARTHPADISPVEEANWKALLDGSGLKEGDDDVLPQLMSSCWDQDSPYNALCPENSVTGCVATAMAQIMKYWAYPAAGQGSHTYNSPFGELTADFGHSFYQWDSMPNNPTTLTSEYCLNEIATIMYHCGVSVDMYYGTSASSASGLSTDTLWPSANNALRNYFGYSPDMYALYRDYSPETGEPYSSEQWLGFVLDELRQHHPIMYCGGQHAFVCDGYDEQHYLHFNFGWDCSGNGYYPIDAITVQPEGYHIYHFNSNEIALFGLEPLYDLRTSDTMFVLLQEGGTDSLVLTINPTVDSEWAVESSAEWLSVEHPTINQAGWVRFQVAPFDDFGERSATLTFRQGNALRVVRVTQVNYSEADLCPLTVEMHSTLGATWRCGAHLEFKSVNGYVFGTASLDEGYHATVQIPVSSHDVMAIWHSGGGSDRYISYRILNSHGQELANVGNAFNEACNFLIVWPCSPLDIEPAGDAPARWNAWPNPCKGWLTLEGDGLQHATLLDLLGNTLMETAATNRPLDLRSLPSGVYFLRMVQNGNVSTQKIIKR